MIRQTPCSCNGWAKYALLSLLAAGGGAGGLYLSGGWPAATRTPSSTGDPTDNQPALPGMQRFPLSTFDVRDQIEAPKLAADSAGRVFLTWASQTGEAERTLFLTRSEEGRPFAEPRAITKSGIFRSVSQMKGKPVTRELKLLPHVATAGDRVSLAWTEALPDQAGVRMMLASSTDNGTTFGSPQCVHGTNGARPTFTALAIGPGGLLACSWLDNREKSQHPFLAIRPAGQVAFEAERSVYAGQDGKGTCPCCPTALVIGSDGTTYVAYRNLHDGYRDIAISRTRPGQSGFDGPFPVVPPSWKFDGCPHDGPSLALVGESLHVVWMDARSGSSRCYHGQARVTDMQFDTHELNPSGVGTQGNPRLIADSAGGLHVVWEESLEPEPAESKEHRHHGPPKVGNGGGRAIRYALLPVSQGEFGPARTLAAKPGAFQTRPTIVGTAAGDLFVAWNELDETGKAVVVTRLSQGGQP